LTLALTSCLLTIYLTNSTTFVTRKESGVASSPQLENKDASGIQVAPKRKVMYYVSVSLSLPGPKSN